MICIEASTAERGLGRYTLSHLHRAQAALAEDGAVILRDVVDRVLLDALKRRMDLDSRTLLDFCESIGGNPRAQGHLQQGPPPCQPYVAESLFGNPFVSQVLAAVLGNDAYCEFFNGNTNCPGSEYQPVHLDQAHPDLTAIDAMPTSAVVVNVVPQDVNEWNGAVELWPGSHRLVVPTPVPEAVVAQRRATVPPVRGVMRRGDALLRDARLWHRGVPNQSADFRHMIALVFVAGATPRRHPIEFTPDCEAILSSAPLDYHVAFTDQPIDYLLGPTKRILARRSPPGCE
jgi:ectoine hydroxylase-related dioxygenase (phytanoyl-CoA dioxygenase family)